MGKNWIAGISISRVLSDPSYWGAWEAELPQITCKMVSEVVPVQAMLGWLHTCIAVQYDNPQIYSILSVDTTVSSTDLNDKIKWSRWILYKAEYVGSNEDWYNLMHIGIGKIPLETKRIYWLLHHGVFCDTVTNLSHDGQMVTNGPQWQIMGSFRVPQRFPLL